MRENKSLSAWRRGEQTIGCWLSLANSYSAESISNLGFDWVCVDLQHGIIDYTDLAQMLPAISTTETTPIVRVPWNEPYEIMKVLDAGAYGVIVPMVNNRSEAEQAVHACRYPPLGNRSFGPIRGALYGGRGYAQEANDQLACIAMIETREGIDNVEE
ncbi:MAG: aldolase/citrate lyase family protein, partial [Pseudomonadales bacterium]|nr:aldolase/citrate lyase family protein [Pseudomonadales bacterium]